MDEGESFPDVKRTTGLLNSLRTVGPVVLLFALLAPGSMGRNAAERANADGGVLAGPRATPWSEEPQGEPRETVPRTLLARFGLPANAGHAEVDRKIGPIEIEHLVLIAPDPIDSREPRWFDEIVSS